MITVHMDVVGSLLRPPELLRAREDAAGGRLSRAGLKAAEDRAVDAAVVLQEEAGLAVQLRLSAFADGCRGRPCLGERGVL